MATTKIDRAEALLLAQELLAQIQPPDVARKAILQAYPDLTEAGAAKIVRKAEAEIVKALSSSAEELRSTVVSRSDALYRKAFRAGKLSTCVEILKLQSKLFGVEKATQHSHTVTVRADEFEARSNEELAHYVAHGRWPEERTTH